jgi:DNA-binding LacI/PurR family transcriptional regulator
MGKQGRPVTMKAVAEKAGVSLMTVSRALRNEGRIAPATRKHILGIAEELGYRPNPLVAALMADLRRARPVRSSVQTIAFVTSHPTAEGWRKDFTPVELFAGAHARADLLGFDLAPFWTKAPEMPGSRLSRILRTRGISGVILAPFPVPAAGPVDLDWASLAAVALGYSLREPRLHRVTHHSLHAIRTALAQLTGRGYRRIGLAVSAGDDERVDHNWSTGFAAYQAGVAVKDRIPAWMPTHPDAAAFNDWRRTHTPEVIIGGSYVGRWLREEKVEVPGQTAFVSLSYSPSLGDVAGIVPNHHAVGAAAVELLVEQLYHNEKGVPEPPRIVLVEGEWREGNSIRPAGR